MHIKRKPLLISAGALFATALPFAADPPATPATIAYALPAPLSDTTGLDSPITAAALTRDRPTASRTGGRAEPLILVDPESSIALISDPAQAPVAVSPDATTDTEIATVQVTAAPAVETVDETLFQRSPGGANIRSAASMSADVVGHLTFRSEARIDGRLDDWARLAGTDTWVHRSLLTATRPQPPTPPAANTQQPTPPPSAPAPQAAGGIVGTALQFQGVPYVHGGMSPSGFDCSGFVGYVFRLHGISLPRTSGGIRNVGTPIPRSQAQPGDIIWSPGHVAIYVGGGQQIDAPRPGRTVQVRGIWQSNPVFLRVG